METRCWHILFYIESTWQMNLHCWWTKACRTISIRSESMERMRRSKTFVFHWKWIRLDLCYTKRNEYTDESAKSSSSSTSTSTSISFDNVSFVRQWPCFISLSFRLYGENLDASSTFSQRIEVKDKSKDERNFNRSTILAEKTSSKEIIYLFRRFSFLFDSDRILLWTQKKK